LQVLLNKVLSEGALAELANPVSGVVILLLVSLRQTFATGPSEARGQVSILPKITNNGLQIFNSYIFVTFIFLQSV
jgi:hypothetical protein